MFLSLASFQAGLQEGSELEEARSCDCQLVFRGQRALGGERESERGCLGVWLYVGPGERVQGSLGCPRTGVCGCLGVCRSRSLDSRVCLCACESAPVNVHAFVRCLCARFLHLCGDAWRPVHTPGRVCLSMLSLSPPHSQGHLMVRAMCVCVCVRTCVQLHSPLQDKSKVKVSLLLGLLLGTISTFHLSQSPWPLAFLS